jgi:hypothetical protein
MLSVKATLSSPDGRGQFMINSASQAGNGVLHAGTSSTLDAAGPAMQASSGAQAGFEDIITVSYGPLHGQPGLLYVSYSLSGSASSTGQNTSFTTVRMFAGTSLEQHYTKLHSSSEWGQFSVPQAIRFTYGVPFGLELLLDTTTRLGAHSGAPSETASGTANLVEDLVLSGLKPADQQGNLVTGAQFTSVSGMQYGLSGVDPAPVSVSSDQPPFISSLHPFSGPPGTAVTASGSGFVPTGGVFGQPGGGVGDYGGNTVYLGSQVVLKNQNSDDRVTLQFDIPQNMGPGTYSVSITNDNGKSNSVNFTVTAN